MKIFAFIFIISSLALSGARAQRDEAGILGEVETIWRGIRYQVLRLERIPADRLLVVVRILATRQAPPSGTLIGTEVPVPDNIPKEEAISARYAPRPFSLASSKMIDEQTERQYPALSPLPSAERNYIPGEVLGLLRPGQAEILTVQFSLPARTEPASQKQSVSFLFPNAKGPIAKVPVPAPVVPGDPAGQGR
jgi:hypothetical protein